MGTSPPPSAKRRSLNRTILRLALPTIFMNISIPLLGAVDTAVVGHLPGATALAGVGVGSAIFTLIYWAFGFFRMSTVGLSAQSHGRGDAQGAMDVLGRSSLLAVGIGLLVIALQGPILTWSLWFVEPSTQVAQQAEVYFKLRIWAAPAAFLLWVFQGWFYGIKRIAAPVMLTILVNTSNIVLDLVFVLYFHQGVAGVALATLISQWVGVAITLAWFVISAKSYWRLFCWKGLLQKAKMWEMLRLNRDIFLRTLALQAVTFYFVKASAVYGDAVLAANTVLIQLRMLAAYALDGFATAAEVVVGNALGAANHPRFKRAVVLCMAWSLGVGCLIGLVYAALSPWWPRWFTTNPQTLEAIALFMLWIFIEPLLSNVSFALDGVFVGASAGKMMRNGMLLSAVLVFFPSYWLLAPHLGSHGLWLAMDLFYLARAATLYLPLQCYLKSPSVHPLR